MQVVLGVHVLYTAEIGVNHIHVYTSFTPTAEGSCPQYDPAT